MKQFLTLLKLNFKAMLLSTGGFGSGSKKKKRKALSGVGVLVLLSALMLYIGGVYAFMLSSVLAPVNALDLVVGIMAILAAFMCFIFTAFNSQGLLFGGKDIDILFSLPISPFAIMLSKVTAVYLENLVFTFFLVGPAGYAYLHYMGFDALFVVLLLVCLLFFPFLATLLAVLVSFLMSLISARMKHKNLITTLLSFVGVGAILLASFQLNKFMGLLSANPNGFRIWLSRYLPPVYWMIKACTQRDLLSLLLFIAVCVIPFLLFVYLISLSYKSILTGLLSQHTSFHYHLGELRSSSPFKALFNKELRRFFGTPMYLVNSGIGAVFVLAAGVAALLYRSSVQGFVEMFPAELQPMLPVLLAAALCFFITTIQITPVSISLEGKTLWLLKEAPISSSLIFLCKILVQLLVVGVPLAFTVPALAYVFRLSALQGLLLFLAAFSFAVFFAVAGIVVNLFLPRLDYTNENMVIKQSASLIICLFGSMLFLVLMGFLYYKLLFNIHPVYFMLIFTGFDLFLTGAMVAFLSKKGQQMFYELD